MKTIRFFLLLLVTALGHSKTIHNGWNCFEGSIGQNAITVNIFCDSIGNLSGDYCYHKYETRIRLKGKVKDGSVFLDELAEGTVTAKFNGTINEEQNTISGKWSSATQSDKLLFLRLSSQNGNLPGARYQLDAEDGQVESFFAKSKKAVLSDDKNWLSKNIDYPIKVDVANKRVSIKNAKSFIAHYSKIITADYKAKISKACVCDIFSNGQGAMIANGSLWINAENEEIKIIAINN